MDLLEGMTTAAQAVGAQLLARPRPAPATTMAEFRKLFDEVDSAAVDLLRTHLSTLRPGVPWADELDTELPATGEVWVVDATDGAVQYLQGLPQWCVSVTLVRDLHPVAAVLHNPVQGETYSATAGGGSALGEPNAVAAGGGSALGEPNAVAAGGGSALVPSRKADLDAAVVAFSHPPFVAAQPVAVSRTARTLAAVLPVVGAVRNLGPTSWQIADVAAGRLDAFWQHGRDDTNVLPGAVIATEAGALVTDATGAPWHPGADSVLVAAPPLHRQLLALMSGSGA